MKLTARQILWIDEITADIESEEQTLKIALARHANRTNELLKQQREFWKELSELHGLDLDKITYTIKQVDGAASIVESSKKE